MEFIQHADGSRTPIPESVIAAADNRDLVAQYAAASDADRKAIEARAIAATTSAAEPAPASPATSAPQAGLEHDE